MKYPEEIGRHRGQSIVEYALILAAVVLVTLFTGEFIQQTRTATMNYTKDISKKLVDAQGKWPKDVVMYEEVEH